MHILSRLARGAVCAAALLAAGFSACQVLPPEHSAATASGAVRAGTDEHARSVAELFEALQPQVLRLLPEARPRSIDVWVQETPALYRFALAAYQDADGFFSESEDRIHLRAGAENLERTLAHELVHAHLRGAWSALPGTLEEGLCDHVSTVLSPEGRAALRAGRLSCAAFALGGMALELEVEAPAAGLQGARRIQARLCLEGEPPMRVDPLEVFDRQAGLSSTKLSTPEKKAYYGLAFLVVERIVRRVGIEGLHALCASAKAAEGSRIERDVLLAAAGLEAKAEAWRTAVILEFEPADLRELVRAHPEFLVRTLDEFLDSPATEAMLEETLPGLQARLSLAGSNVTIDLLQMPELRKSLAALARGRTPDSLARR